MGDQSRAGSARSERRTRSVWLAAAVGAAMFSFVLLAPHLGARVGQAQGGRGNLLRFCPGLGIPCVEITREAYDRGHDAVSQVVRLLPWANGRGRQRRTESALLRSHPPGQ